MEDKMKVFKGNVDELLEHITDNQKKLSDVDELYYEELLTELKEMEKDGIIESYVGSNGKTYYKLRD
jgi:predicted methyltransferase